MQALNRYWYGDRLWILITLRPSELRLVFPDRTWESLRAKRKLYKRKIKNGEETAALRPSWYEVDMTPKEIREHLENTKGKTTEEIANELISVRERELLHKELDRVLDEKNINPSFVKSFSVSTGHHEGYIKNADSQIEYTKQLKRGGIRIIATPKHLTPQFTPVTTPVSDINYIKTVPQTKNKKLKTCVILPDPQIGFRKNVEGDVFAFHDENAISIALQVIADIQPDKVVCLGDLLDLATFGKYEQSEDFSHMTQKAINYAYRLLGTIRATSPNSEIVVIEGNHDKRIEKSVKTFNMFAFGLRRADDIKGWPVFSVPNLLAFDRLKVLYVDGYPAGRYWINKRIQCIHGNIVRQAGATAAAVVKQQTVSTVFGHIHRIETAYDTQNVYGGARSNLAHSPGTLCRIDGSVPSVKGGVGLDGRPVTNYENWQQGIAIVDYVDGDQPFSLHSIYINTHQNYMTTVNNRVYFPDKSIIKTLND